MAANLGDTLRAAFGHLLPAGAIIEPPLEALAWLQPTEALQGAVDMNRAVLTALGSEGGDTARARIAQRLAAAERELANGQRRDQIMAERRVRFDGCFCLGLGGKWPVGIPVPTAETHGDGSAVVEVVEAFREFCTCPEGAASRLRAYDATARRERWVQGRRIEAAWGDAQIPAEYRDLTLESYPGDKRAVPALRAWLTTDAWLILHGSYGSGKTGLTCAVLRLFAAQGKSVLFVNLPTMLRRVRATFDRGNGGATEQKVVASLAEAGVLALDDLGAERLTEWGQELLYDVVNRRYSEGRRTIVSTNLPVFPPSEGGPSLQSHVEERTFWRIFEKSKAVSVTGNLRIRRTA